MMYDSEIASKGGRKYLALMSTVIVVGIVTLVAASIWGMVTIAALAVTLMVMAMLSYVN